MTQKCFDMETAKAIVNGEVFGNIKTRDGFDVTILHWAVNTSFPIAGIVHLGENNDYCRQWTSQGKGDVRPNVTMQCDLIIETEGGEA
jgi:hypothetical protein